MMQPIRLAHLYPDCLNLYGDFGNLLALRHRAKLRGLEVSYHRVSLGDRFDPKAYDFCFIGGGQDQEQSQLLQDLKQKRTAILEAAESGLPFLCICGGYQLMGQAFYTQSGDVIEGLGFLPVETRGASERLIGDVVVSATWLGSGEFSQLFGFENHSGRTRLFPGATPLGTVLYGNGNDETSKTEGCVRNHVYGTYLHGSFLPKNPAMTDHLLQLACQNRLQDRSYHLEPCSDPLVDYARILERSRLQQKGIHL